MDKLTFADGMLIVIASVLYILILVCLFNTKFGKKEKQEDKNNIALANQLVFIITWLLILPQLKQWDS